MQMGHRFGAEIRGFLPDDLLHLIISRRPAACAAERFDLQPHS